MKKHDKKEDYVAIYLGRC